MDKTSLIALGIGAFFVIMIVVVMYIFRYEIANIKRP